MTSDYQVRSLRLIRHNILAVFATVTMLAIAPASHAQTATTQSESLTTNSAVSNAAPKGETAPAADANETTYSIVLAGEVVGLNLESPRKNYPNLVLATTSTLGADVTNFTKPGVTLPETAEQIKNATDINADVAVIFGGYSDEVNDVPEEQISAAIQTIAKSLKTRNPDMRIFLLPSATYMGTLMSARMRLAAEANNITFYPLGTEVSGEPFTQAMATVAAEFNTTKRTEEPQAAQPEHAVTVRAGKIDNAVKTQGDTTQPQEYEAKKASLQRELNRVAGEVGDEPSLAGANDALSTASLTDGQTTSPAGAEETPLPPGGKVTVRGKDAKEEIQMRSLPALKAFRPQIPVPRNEIDKKEPALSR